MRVSIENYLAIAVQDSVNWKKFPHASRYEDNC
jgi:hypothetical protein